MSSSLDNADVVPQEQPRGGTHEISYLVKRPSYTLAITASRPFPTGLSWEQAVFQARLTQRGQRWSYVLTPRTGDVLRGLTGASGVSAGAARAAICEGYTSALVVPPSCQAATNEVLWLVGP
jgi:hypothetical protein